MPSDIPYYEHPGASGELKLVHAWTDGSNLKDAGGWAAILQFGETEKEISGGVRDASVTNNRMEMLGALEALFACKRPVEMVIHTDSAYVANGWTMYLPSWVRRDWKTAGDHPKDVANQDLWQAFLLASRVHTFRFEKVKGHSGVEMNERVDRLAGAARLDAASWKVDTAWPADPLAAQRAREVVSGMLGV